MFSIASGNFILENGGAILETIPKERFNQLLDELFLTLVLREAATPEKDSTEALEVECESVLKDTELSKRKHFRKGQIVMCKVGNVTESIEFSYSLANGA